MEAKVRAERPLRPYLSDCVPACAVCLGFHETAACPLIERWPGDHMVLHLRPGSLADAYGHWREY